MSFRDLRNFTEMMRTLSYPRLISLDNFRRPNFRLVAEILRWLVKKFDPLADVIMDIGTEQDRVMFVMSVVEFMSAKAFIKVNPKRLYGADGYAVKELLKMTTVLYKATQLDIPAELEDIDFYPTLPFEYTNEQLDDLKEVRLLTTILTEQGANLYDLLNKEVEMREIRSMVLAQPLEMNEVEQELASAIYEVHMDIQRTEIQLNIVSSDYVNLEAKVERKQGELERNTRRLQILRSVRPAYLDEYEQLEEELAKIHEAYAHRFRRLSYLEQQLEDYNHKEQELMEESEAVFRVMALKIQQEERKQLSINDSANDDDGNASGTDENDSEDEASRIQTKHTSRPEGEGQTDEATESGDMNPDSEDTESDGSGDSDSDSDVEFNEADIEFEDNDIAEKAGMLMLNGMLMDAAMLDTTMLDTTMLDAAMLDAAMLDAAMLDTTMLDTTMLDAAMLDTTMLDGMGRPAKPMPDDGDSDF